MVPMDNPIEVLVVDDEPVARRGLKLRLEQESDFRVVGEAGAADQGAAEVRELRPDIVFLDIEMPGMSGLDMLGALPTDVRPLVVIVTAYDEYAVEAFGIDAVDYVLKPIDDRRFAETLDRVRKQISERRSLEVTDRMLSLLGNALPRNDSERLTRIQVRNDGTIHFLPVSTIDWIEGAGDYLRLHTGDDQHLIRMTMKYLADRLPTAQFARIHRSAIVNVDRVVEVEPYVGGEYLVRLVTGEKLKLSRSYRDSFLSRGL